MEFLDVAVATQLNSTTIAAGPISTPPPNDIIAPIEGYSGVKLADIFALPNLDREIKWHCKCACQNGIHVPPTFMIDRRT